MKLLGIALGIVLVSSSLALAQSSGGGSSGGAATSGGTGADGAAGGTLSRGGTINGTGGSPGPNTSNALRRGTTGNDPRVNRSDTAAGSQPYSSPAADAAINKLGNTDTGILKK